MRDRCDKPPPEQAAGDGGNVDRLLFKNLVEMVPLVESLMDRRVNSSYARRAALVYTPAPVKKAADSKNGKKLESLSAKKQRDTAKKSTTDSNGDDSAVASLGVSGAENKPVNKDEVALLREQIDDLQKKLLEKDEALKSAECLVSQLQTTYSTIDELRRQLAEKEALIKSTSLQLHGAKIMLANKQASLEKLEWEAKMSNKKIEDLQRDVSSMDFEISAFMALFEEISENVSADFNNGGIPSPSDLEELQSVSDIDNIETGKIEQERATYSEALAAARENPDEEHLNLAAEARLRLQVHVL